MENKENLIQRLEVIYQTVLILTERYSELVQRMIEENLQEGKDIGEKFPLIDGSVRILNQMTTALERIAGLIHDQDKKETDIPFGETVPPEVKIAEGQ